MGAVHGVHLKYAAMSAVSALGASSLATEPWESSPNAWFSAVVFLWYAAICHGLITALFLLRRGEFLLGKRHSDGTLPTWSFVVWAAFHLPTYIYTYVHTAASSVPVASEVQPGWWIGGRYAHKLPGSKRWALTIDLTVEFPEGCFDTSQQYLLLPCWDGTPPSPSGIERAARLAAECYPRGDVMVHCACTVWLEPTRTPACAPLAFSSLVSSHPSLVHTHTHTTGSGAHGRGRSTCVMVACLVRAGAFSTWRDAFEACCKNRKGIKLNKKMRDALDEWAAKYP